ncbi:MAG: hypothetical protein JNK20_13630 [Flavipsychrobacter sp.]|nr:hypothetical protein [Flavipsychrobacter sp.]
MAKGCYSILHNESKTDLIFEIKPEIGAEIPDEQQNLVIDIGNALAIIALLYKPKTVEFAKAFEQLFYISKTGLEGETAQPSLATKALTQFKKEIVDKESGKKKNEYLKQLGIRALVGCFPLLLTGSFINYLACYKVHCDCIQLNYIANMLILVSGTLIGVWLSFAITRTYIGFDDLVIIEKDRLEPTLRLIFTGVLSIIFGFLFIKNSIEIKIGNLSSKDILKDPVTAFLIGTILGLNEKIIGSTLTKKTTDSIK